MILEVEFKMKRLPSVKAWAGLLILLPFLVGCQPQNSSSQTGSSVSSDSESSVSSSVISSLPSSDVSALFTKQSLSSRNIYVYDVSSLNDDELRFVVSLQGLLIRKGQGCYLTSGEDAVFKKASSLYEMTNFSSLASFSKQALSDLRIGKYIAFESDCLSASFAAYFSEPLVSSSLESFAESLGLMKDAVVQSYAPLFMLNASRKLAIEDSDPLAYLDFGIAQGAFFMPDQSVYQGTTAFSSSLGNKADMGLRLDMMGSKRNLSFYGAIPKKVSSSSEVVSKTNQHYVSVVCEDALTTNLLGESHAVSPFLQSEFPAYFQNSFPTEDSFVNDFQGLDAPFASPSFNLINAAASDSLSTVGFFGANQADSLSSYSYLGSLDGGIVDSIDGKLHFENQKPFLSFSGVLKSENAYELACALNQASTETSSAASYSLIQVVSGTSLGTLKKFYSALSPAVKISRVTDLLKWIRQNVSKVDSTNLLPTNVSTSSIGEDYSLYDMFQMKYGSANYSSPFSFGKGFSGFSAHSYQSQSSIGNQDGVVVMQDHGQASAITNSLSIKLGVSGNRHILNFKVKSSQGSACQIRVYDLTTDRWILVGASAYANLCFQTISLDLSSAFGSRFPDAFGLAFEQIGTANRDQTLSLDDVSLTSQKERDSAFDDPSTKLTSGEKIPLSSEAWHSEGDVSFANGVLTLSSSREATTDGVASSAWKKMAIAADAGYSSCLNLDYAVSGSAQIRMRTVDDKNYIDDTLIPWKTLTGAGSFAIDLSSKENSDLLLFIEFNRLSGQAQSLSIDSLTYSPIQGHYAYESNVVDSFNGTSEEWNQCGWHLGGNATYGDLTADNGFGSLRFDGSNGGFFDPALVLCSAEKWYQLQASKKETLRFFVRSGGPADATFYRVRVESPDGTYHIVSSDTNSGWILVSGEAWTSMEFDLSAYAGSTIGLLLEQTDHGSGIGEICFVDSITIAEGIL